MRAPWDEVKARQFAGRISDSLIRRFDQGASS
jgi:hypothetical protein